MYGDMSIALVTCMVIFLYHNKVDAGPMKRASRMVREVYPEIEPENEGSQAQVCIVGDVVYGVDETVMAEQPCLKCRCQPPGVQCETIQCVKKPGCKAIHRSNKCCPDYQCKCEHNGKIYANGERLEVQPGGECKVCYCRGGEVQCAEVSCYIRKDCEAKRVPGQCCPKYDNCPPIDAVQERTQFTTEGTLLSTNHEISDPWSVTPIPQNITVVSPVSDDIQDENKIPDTAAYATTTPSKENEFIEVQKEQGMLPRITIQEIIPERKEIPITAPPKIEEPHGTLIIEESLGHVENTSNDLATPDSEPDSSEVSEVFQQPPPVLRIGDKLLFLKKGEYLPEQDRSTPSSVITIIGAEGLQRGFEDSGETHDVKENKTKNIEKAEDDSELKTSESTHILSLVKKKNIPVVITTTTVSTEVSQSTEIPSTNDPELLSSSTTETIGSEETTQLLENLNVTDATDIENVTEAVQIPTETVTKSTEPIGEQNPAYPPIPDIMAPQIDDTSQRFDTESKPLEQQQESGKILSDVLDIRSNKTIPTNTSHSDWLKKENDETLINYKAILPDDLLNQPAPTDLEETTENIIDTSTQSNNEGLSSTPEIAIEKLIIVEGTSAEETKNIVKNNEESNRSVESLESEETLEDSGESTTPKSNHSSLLSDENASVENIGKSTSETTDMLSLSTKEIQDSSEKVETVTKTVLEDVEVIDKITFTRTTNTNETPVNKDVEFVDVDGLKRVKPTIVSEKIETTTHEFLPKPEQFSSKVILKRESSANEEAEEVFKELEREIIADSSERSIPKEEEEKEAGQIFKQLLEETSSQKADQPRSKETERFDRISNAIAQLAFRRNEPDANLLGVLSNFFSSQYRDPKK